MPVANYKGGYLSHSAVKYLPILSLKYIELREPPNSSGVKNLEFSTFLNTGRVFDSVLSLDVCAVNTNWSKASVNIVVKGTPSWQVCQFFKQYILYCV